jgi:hypothetical protein
VGAKKKIYKVKQEILPTTATICVDVSPGEESKVKANQLNLEGQDRDMTLPLELERSTDGVIDLDSEGPFNQELTVDTSLGEENLDEDPLQGASLPVGFISSTSKFKQRYAWQKMTRGGFPTQMPLLLSFPLLLQGSNTLVPPNGESQDPEKSPRDDQTQDATPSPLSIPSGALVHKEGDESSQRNLEPQHVPTDDRQDHESPDDHQIDNSGVQEEGVREGNGLTQRVDNPQPKQRHVKTMSQNQKISPMVWLALAVAVPAFFVADRYYGGTS